MPSTASHVLMVETAKTPFSGAVGGRTSSGTGPKNPVSVFITHRLTIARAQASGISRHINDASCQMSLRFVPLPA